LSPSNVCSWLVVAGLTVGCATTRTRGRPRIEPLDRATIARCQFALSGVEIGVGAVEKLAGRYLLYMTSDAEPTDQTAGHLDLRVGGAGSDPDAPSLIGASDIDPAEVGAVVPGALASTDESAPGVGAYVFVPDPDRPSEAMAVLRLGAESNRRDRQRFDGAHTTLLITTIAEDRFGGTWSSARGAEETSGGFCAVRS